MRSLIFVVPLALYACGEDAITIVPDDGGTSADGSTTRDGSTGGGGDSSTGNDSGTSNDGGTTNDTGTGGGDSGSNPGQVTCGTETCSSTQECCFTFDGGVSRTCVNKGSCGGAAQQCDEAADCSNNGKCCAGFGGGAGRAECKATCGQQEIQICKTAGECASGTCGTYSCFGQQVRACTQPPGCQ